MVIGLLVAAAFGAGLMNALAGGGSFLTFPALVYAGVPSVMANASSTVAILPGTFTSAWTYRRHLKPFPDVSTKLMLSVSLAGGVVGAILLLATPQRSFDAIVPWLLLLATLLFAFGRRVTPALQRMFRPGPRSFVAIQFLVAIYGGYFGGAVGILMLASFAMFGHEDLNAMNANKSLLNGAMNSVAVICFVLAGMVAWPPTLVMLVAGMAGGYLGALLGPRLDPRLLRALITAIGALMTVVFFLRR